MQHMLCCWLVKNGMTRCIQKGESRHVQSILSSMYTYMYMYVYMINSLSYDNQGMHFCAVRLVGLRLRATMIAMSLRLISFYVISFYVDAVLADSVLP